MEFLTEPVPNDEAADFIRNKPALTKGVFDQLLPELKARAFTITGLETANAVQAARDLIATLPQGGDWETIKRDLANQISPYLIDSDADEETQAGQRQGAETRAELILRLHGFQAYSAAAHRALDAQRDVFPYWQYKSMGDGRVRATHAALNDTVLPAGDIFWRGHYPPWEWGCRCQVVGLMEIDADEIRDADKDKPLEQRRIKEGAAYQQLTQQGHLVKGPNEIFDVRSPKEKGKPNAFAWDPADLRLPLADLKSRYDAPVWDAFEGWARGQAIPGQGRTVWEWLEGGLGDGETRRLGAAADRAQPDQPGFQIANSPKTTEIEITPDEHRTDHAELQTVAQRSREAFQSGESGYHGAPVSREEARSFSAEIAAVVAGRKPLFHEQLGQELSRPLVPLLREALGDGATVEERDGHLYIFRPEAIGLTLDEIHALTLTGSNGALLGYGRAHLNQPGTEIVVVEDLSGSVLGGFHAFPDEAEAIARARAADYSDALGIPVRIRIIERNSP